MSKETPYQVFVGRLEAIGQRDELEMIARRSGVTLEALFTDVRQSAALGRVRCYNHLHKLGKNFSEIAELFDRDHTTILAAMKKGENGVGLLHRNGKKYENSSPSPEMVASQLPMLLSMARELDRTASELSEPLSKEYARGKAEGIRSTIRLLFPLREVEGQKGRR